MAPFVDQVHPTMVIKGILSAYPFSLGLFREFLQNSDDAGATKQVFVLDHRSYAQLAVQEGFSAVDACGPSFIAFNNALMQEDDWHHLQRSHDSSKSSKSSKIGKYGVGFRSCYHITDTPQIISGNSFAWFDPIRWSGGRVPIQDNVNCRRAFEPVLSDLDSMAMDGTAFRLPLRTSASNISDAVFPPRTILDLLKEFVNNELPIVLLFLQSVVEVEIRVINLDGECLTLAKVLLSKEPEQDVAQSSLNQQSTTRLYKMSVTKPGLETVEVVWRMYSLVQDTSGVVYKHLESMFPRLPGLLIKHKLRPEVSLAFPLLNSRDQLLGRLFTYLPLPIASELPFHIHSLFALTQSRQHLRNSDEIGLVTGSDDLFLVEWNKALIHSLIPQAISQLLLTLIRDDGIEDIFSAWPLGGETGDSAMIWPSLLADILHVTATDKLPLWPVLPAPGDGSVSRFVDIGSVFIADQESSLKENDKAVQALVKSGIQICLVPARLLHTLQTITSITYELLSPAGAHQKLQVPEILGQLEILTPEDKRAILSYLGQTDDVQCMIGLPLIPSRSGTYFTLQRSANSLVIYTLMTSNELALFSVFDVNAICLDDLPEAARQMIQNQGPGHLNVRNLSPTIIGDLLSISPSPVGLDAVGEHIEPDTTGWLNRFWLWMKTKRFAEEGHVTREILSDLPLVPTRNGLHRLSEPVFGTVAGLHPALMRGFFSLQMPFFATSFESQCIPAIASYGNIQSPENIHHVLAFTGSRAVDVFGMQDARVLLDFVAGKLALETLSPEEGEALRRLPIYPIVLPSINIQGNNTNLRPIVVAPISESYQSARLVSEVKLLPFIPGRVWVENLSESGAAAVVLRSFGFKIPKMYRTIDAIEEALSVFDSQPLGLQTAFVRYLRDHERRVPRSLLQRLSSTTFVSVLGGIVCCPQDVIDPNSTLARLFTFNGDGLYVAEEPMGAMIQMLSGLGLLRCELDSLVVNDRIRWISDHKDDNMARALISLLHSQKLHDEQIAEVLLMPELRWLPTPAGFKSHLECRDPRSAVPALCDETYAFLASDIVIPSYLYGRLGWLGTVSFDVVLYQLHCTIVGSQDTGRFDIIFKYLVQNFHHFSQSQTALLRGTIVGENWLPVEGEKLATAERLIIQSVSSADLKLPGFHAIRVVSGSSLDKFLRFIGCSDQPSVEELLRQLEQLKMDSTQRDVVSDIIRVLKYLPSVIQLSGSQVKNLVAPDTSGFLRPLAQLYYNDTANAYLDIADTNGYVAHRKISKQMATKLGLELLGQMIIPDLGTRYFGEAISTRLRNVLKEYTERQMLLESLANACDAGASEFGILLDEHEPASSNFFTDSMASLHAGHSLVLYNDGVFSPSDWDAICSTGDSLKADEAGRIGQFGLGSLAMFHVTEMVTVVSGDRVLFLDPTVQFLPPRYHQRKAFLADMRLLKSQYPGHLKALYGLYGFSREVDFYNGTLFRLPFRQQPSSLSTSVFKIQDMIPHADDFLKDAQKSLLFTQLSQVTCRTRTSDGRIRPRWTLLAERKNQRASGGVKYHQLSTKLENFTPKGRNISTAKWVIVSSIVEVPPKLHLVDRTNRMKTTKIGVAVPYDTSRLKAKSSSFFSTLPLPVATSLPVEISASFIVSSDRRSIRDDNFEHVEVQYNRWVVSQAIPPIYLRAINCFSSGMELWPELWPSVSASSQMEACLVGSLYETHLIASSLPIFEGMYGPGGKYLTVGQVVFLPEDLPSSVRDFLAILQPDGVAAVPRGRELEPVFVRAGLKFMEPPILASILHVMQADSAESFAKAREVRKLYPGLLDYLLQEQDIENIVGLELLPLADLSWTTFSRSGDANFHAVPRMMHGFLPPDLIANPNYITEKSTVILGRGLNIEKLSPAVTRDLICRKLSPADSYSATKEEAAWIRKLWSHFDSLPEETCLDDLPLILTTQPSLYVSQAFSKSGSVIVLKDDAEIRRSPRLKRSLDLIGVRLVIWNLIQEEGGSVVEPSRQSLFHDILVFLSDRISSIPKLFQRLSEANRQFFAGWLAERVSNGESGRIKRTMRSLPIWVERSPDNTQVYCTANDISCMLPAGVSPQIASDYLDCPFVEYSPDLQAHLDISPISLMQFKARLKPTLNLTGLTAFRNYAILLEALLELATTPTSLPVPNGQGEIVQSNTLYRREPLFEATFDSAPTSPDFLHTAFVQFEMSLVQKGGLQASGNLTSSLFRRCALAYQEYQGEDQIAKANTIFLIYCQDLALQGTRNGAYEWDTLSALRFIPSIDISERRHPPLPAARLSIDLTPYIKSLPPIISPNEVVIDDGNASAGVESLQFVAWTQRSRVQLDSRSILVANPNFGQPSAADVVNHLLALVQMVTDHPKLQPYLWTDLRNTYFWLNSKCQQSEVTRLLRAKEDEALFLNVEDPTSSDEWNWSCSQDLFFNDGSDWDPEDAQPVHSCLMPFRSLLISLGVQDVVKVEARTVKKIEIPVVGKYIQMRNEKRYVDVVFKTSDGGNLYGHRFLLSAVSEYFWTLFNEGFSESRPADSDNPVEVMVEECAECLELILDAVYNDALASTGNVPTEILLQALELSARWLLTNVFGELQVVLVKRIQLNTYESIAECAERVDALILVGATREFTSKNRNSILWHHRRESTISSVTF